MAGDSSAEGGGCGDDASFSHLVACYEEARHRNEHPMTATIKYVACHLDAPLLARDPFQFALVLGVWLLYLYTRSLPAAVATIAVFYALELLVFAVAQLALRNTCASLHRHYSRTNARIADPLVLLCSLFSVHGALEFTVLGRSGAAFAFSRADIAAATAHSQWRAALVVGSLLVVGIAPRRRALAALAVGLAVAIVWLVDCAAEPAAGARQQLAAWTLVRALGLLALACVAMLVPLGPHYIQNAWLANAALLFFACSATFACT